MALFSVDFFSGFALTFAGNTYLIKICVWDFQSSINRLCVTFHIAIFSPYCCLYCLYEQGSAHISFALRFAVIVDRLKHKNMKIKHDFKIRVKNKNMKRKGEQETKIKTRKNKYEK